MPLSDPHDVGFEEVGHSMRFRCWLFRAVGAPSPVMERRSLHMQLRASASLGAQVFYRFFIGIKPLLRAFVEFLNLEEAVIALPEPPSLPPHRGFSIR